MFKLHRFLSTLALAVLLAPIAQAETENFVVDIGEVEEPAQNFSWAPSAGTTDSIVTFNDNNTLVIDAGLLGFFIDSSGAVDYTGYLLDPTGKMIPGTDFTGITNVSATNFRLDALTIFSGMFFDLGDDQPTYSLVWVDPPTVKAGPGTNQAPTADAGEDVSGSVGVEVCFDGSGSSDPEGKALIYSWQFGDGIGASGTEPCHIYEGVDDYNVTLTVIDDRLKQDSDSVMARIGADQLPVADAGESLYTGTVDVALFFDGDASSDAEGPIVKYEWDYGDESIPEVTDTPFPSHIYTATGDYTLTLTVTDSIGQEDWDTSDVTIAEGNDPPVADAGEAVLGVVGRPVLFDGNGSTDLEGPIVRYDWDYGDLSPVDVDAGPEPEHTYNRPGEFNVTLTVYDEGDKQDSDSTGVSIDPANFAPVADANGPYTGPVGVEIPFHGEGSFDLDGEIQTHIWEFGDGRAAAYPPSASVRNIYEQPGNYEVTLWVIDDENAIGVDYTTASIDMDDRPPVAEANGPYAGVVGIPIPFDGRGSRDGDVEGDLENVTLTWDFGDGGAPGNGLEPKHTYSSPGRYEVTVAATDPAGNRDRDVTTAVVSEGSLPPVADTGGPYRGAAGGEVSFDAAESFGRGSEIVSYEWEFGDGDVDSGQQVSHTYALPNHYHVTLTVRDDFGLPVSDSTIAVIGEASEPPIADAGGPYPGSAGVLVSFDGTGSSDEDGNIKTWTWDFGDDSEPKTGPKPKHTYTEAGPYTVTLTVTDNSNESDDDTTEANIGQGNLPPMAEAGGPYIGAAGVAKQFDGSGSSDPNGDDLTYEWDFGDESAPKTGPTPSHIYTEPGPYIVTLTVTDTGELSSSDDATAIIGEPDPDPDDRLIDMVTLGDVGGGPAADVAVLDVGLANGDQVSAAIHVRDGGTGAEIYQVQLLEAWRSVAMESVVGFSGPLLAILQISPDGNIRVQTRNAADGSFNSNVAYFDNTWTPIAMLAISDAGGLGVPGIGVLAENPAGQQAIEVHKVGNGELVNQVLFFNDVWKASYAVDLGEFNGNGYSELAVLATNNAGKHAVETKDTLSGKQISRHFFLGPTNTLQGFAQSADVDGNGKPELIVLGNKEAANNTANTAQAKDVKSGALISKPGSFPPPFVGFALRSMDDADGNNSPEMVIGAFDDEGNVTRVQVRDVLNGTLTLNTGILSAAFDPKDLEILDDTSGNGIQELAAAGLNRDTLAIRVQMRDGLNGALLLNININ